MTLAEPTTTLTDYVLAVEAFWFGARLWRLGSAAGQRSRLWLGAALCVTGAGALVGGTSHGFAPWLAGTIWQTALWKVTLLCLGSTSLLFLWAVSHAALSPRARGWLQAVALLEFAIYAFWIGSHDEFIWAILDYLPAMALALLLLADRARRGSPGAGWIVAGIALTFVGAGIQVSGFTLHRHFNHNDLFHVVQMVAVYWLYRGGLELEDVAGVGGPASAPAQSGR